MMRVQVITRRLIRWRAMLAGLVAVTLTVVSGGCFEPDDGELYYGQVRVPRQQEFRWSDGGLPQTFDPALAAAPPDTDAVRALFEGLTEYDPQTLKPVAGVAARWESSPDRRIWTFYLRRDARWSNGGPVTAQDFVRSWRRTLQLGDRAPHVNLLANIVGATRTLPTSLHQTPAPAPSPAPSLSPLPEPEAALTQTQSADVATDITQTAPAHETAPAATTNSTPGPVATLGVEAIDDLTLRVRLQRPDNNFPALVAHPVFRPVHEPGNQFELETEPTPQAIERGRTPVELKPPIISNGPFRLKTRASDNVLLERAQNYWSAGTVALERVRFVNMRDNEAALAAYSAGEVDAVTNTNVEPLAVKLLAPYKDFHRTTFGALTYYEFNATRPPFDDLRVRQALTYAVDRVRLSSDTLNGASEPAATFMPATDEGAQTDGKQAPAAGVKIVYDVAQAQKLLAEAGYAGGAGFPRIRLLVNRNEQHRAVAQAIAGMWRSALGVETEIVLKSWDEYEGALRAGDYDVARRSVVMQTTDEETNMLAILARPEANFAGNESASALSTVATPTPEGARSQAAQDEPHGAAQQAHSPVSVTQAEALHALPAMPVYFASSYALIKPYVGGFDTNLLDAPSLQRVRIDTNWQPPPNGTLR